MAKVKRVTLSGYGLHSLFTTALMRFDTREQPDQWSDADYECSDEVVSTLRPLAERKAARAAIEEHTRKRLARAAEQAKSPDPSTIVDEEQEDADLVAAVDSGAVAVDLSATALDWVVKRLAKVQTMPTWAGPRARLTRALRNATDETV